MEIPFIIEMKKNIYMGDVSSYISQLYKTKLMGLKQRSWISFLH
jgi:hypothetical protein